MKGIVTLAGLDNDHDTDWSKAVIESFINDIRNPMFPCVFAPWAVDNQLLSASFLEDWRSFKEKLATTIKAYLEHTDASKAHAHAVFVAERCATLKDAEHLFWTALANVPESSMTKSGTWVVFGTEIFFTFHSEHYRQRKSRSTARGNMVLIQRKSNIDVVVKDRDINDRSFKIIRQKVDQFDDIAISPMFGQPNMQSEDWEQFVLDDDNSKYPGSHECPIQKQLT